MTVDNMKKLRAEFEAAMAEKPLFPRKFIQHRDGSIEYVSAGTQHMWQGFLLSARRQPDAGVVEEYHPQYRHPSCTRPNVACAYPECGDDCRHKSAAACTTPPASPVPASVRAAILEEAAELCDGYRLEDYSGVAPSLASAIRALASKPVEVVPEQRCDSTYALKQIKNALEQANGKAIQDTIWIPGMPETLFDFVDRAIAAELIAKGNAS